MISHRVLPARDLRIDRRPRAFGRRRGLRGKPRPDIGIIEKLDEFLHLLGGGAVADGCADCAAAFPLVARRLVNDSNSVATAARNSVFNLQAIINLPRISCLSRKQLSGFRIRGPQDPQGSRNFMRTSCEEKLIKIGAKLVNHGRYDALRIRGRRDEEAD